MTKPPNPHGVPKSHGKKPKAPKPHTNSGRFDNGSNTLNSKGCAVTALALVGVPMAALVAVASAVVEVLS